MRTMLCLMMLCGLMSGGSLAAEQTAGDSREPSEAGVEYLLGCFVLEDCYALPHPEDWNGFAVFPGALEGVAIYPCLLEPGDPAYENACLELERLLAREESQGKEVNRSAYLTDDGHIRMWDLPQNYSRSVNKYLEIIRFETPEDARKGVKAYQNFFAMIGAEIEPDAVFVYRNYTLFDVNYWSEEKCERFKKILVDGVESYDRIYPPEQPTSVQGENYVEDLGEGVTLEMVWIEPATFVMGGGDGLWHQEQAHEVGLDGYWIGCFEVTNAQYRRFFADHVSGGFEGEYDIDGDSQPVSSVSWDDAAAYCERLSEKTGLNYSLPTEAQWEYACGAGAESVFWWGDERDLSCANYWSDDDGFTVSAPVGSFKANAFGLHDMLGNVSEFSLDAASDEVAAMYAGIFGEDVVMRALRGGSYMESDVPTRARDWVRSEHLNQLMGFRVVCIPEEQTGP